VVAHGFEVPPTSTHPG